MTMSSSGSKAAIQRGSSCSLRWSASDSRPSVASGAGNTLIHFALLDAIDRNLGAYNFLQGTETYKYHWANSGDQFFDMFHYKHRVASMLRLASENIKTFGKIIFR